VLGGLAALLISQSVDLVALVAIGFGRAATVGFLRLATLALAQAFDLVTFSMMVARHGTIAEANPIVSNMFDMHGMAAVVLAKVALVLLVGALSVAAFSHDRRGVWALIGGLPLALAIAAGLIGGITNTANLFG
jgi:hypothetical protein